MEDSEHHNCFGQSCSACKRKNKTCPNFATFATPNVYCGDCRQHFYGQNCFTSHKQGKKSVCSKFKKCPECCKVFKFSAKKTHICGEYHCRNCQVKVLPNHQCYIQPMATELSDLLTVQPDAFNPEDRAILEELIEEDNNEKNKEEMNRSPLFAVLISNVVWMRIRILRMFTLVGSM